MLKICILTRHDNSRGARPVHSTVYRYCTVYLVVHICRSNCHPSIHPELATPHSQVSQGQRSDASLSTQILVSFFLWLQSAKLEYSRDSHGDQKCDVIVCELFVGNACAHCSQCDSCVLSGYRKTAPLVG
jgi:hypothetical protein